jgi:hypothetical protein
MDPVWNNVDLSLAESAFLYDKQDLWPRGPALKDSALCRDFKKDIYIFLFIIQESIKSNKVTFKTGLSQ